MSNSSSNYIWSEVFTDPSFEYPTVDTMPPIAAMSDEKWMLKVKLKAVEDALSGWGCCHAGAETPENFGKGMQKIWVCIKDVMEGRSISDQPFLMELSDKLRKLL